MYYRRTILFPELPGLERKHFVNIMMADYLQKQNGSTLPEVEYFILIIFVLVEEITLIMLDGVLRIPIIDYMP